MKVRFAPSPSGHLHLGNARMALFCFLLARRERGVFLLRIEDTDLERSKSAYIEALKQDLQWLGLLWQEGPEREGLHGPYQQSERGGVYETYLETLRQANWVYPCFCSGRDLALIRQAQLKAGQPPRYPGTCAALSPEAVQGKLDQGLEPTLRFRVPRGRTVQFEDLVRGPQAFTSDDIGDFIVQRTDGVPAFFFSNALDDALMGVTHVLRGEDHLTNTPRQLLLLEALNLQSPHYGHVAMLVGPDGAPLSKRHGSYSVQELRHTGYLPEAINNYLARLGHRYEKEDLADLEGLARRFDLTRLGRSSVHFNPNQLQHWQKEAILQVSSERLWEWMGSEVHCLVPRAEQEAFIETVRSNILFPEDALMWARTIYTDSLVLSSEALRVIRATERSFFQKALEVFEANTNGFKAFTAELKGTLGISGKALFQPLRAALTGRLDGPELAGLWFLLGSHRIRARLQAAVESMEVEGESQI